MDRMRTTGLTLMAALLLSGCGGGGGATPSAEDTAPASPSVVEEPTSVGPPPSPTPEAVEGAIDVGAAPGEVAVGFGSVWVSLHHAASVARVDPDTNEVIETIAVGEQPLGIGVGGDALWVLTYADASVWRIDPRTNEAASFPVAEGEACGAPLVTPELVLVRDCGLEVTVMVDPATGRVLGHLPGDVRAGCGGVRHGAIVLVGGGQLVRLDPRTGRVLDRGPGADAPCFGSKGVRGAEVWVGSGEDPTAQTGTVSAISLESGETVRSVEVGRGPDTFATPDSVWVRALNAHEVQRVDPKSFRVTASVPYPDVVSSGGFAVGFGAAWLADFDHDRIVRVDLAE
jgi:YVTN family beta-propeller protein